MSGSVTPEARKKAEKVLGYKFKNPDLLKESLTHASIADNRLQDDAGDLASLFNSLLFSSPAKTSLLRTSKIGR